MIKFIKKLMKKIISSMMSLLPIENMIIFESRPDFSCNTYPVFELLRKKLKNYKFVWFVHSDKCILPIHGEYAILNIDPKFYWERLRNEYYLSRAKALIFSNTILRKRRKNQLSLFLSHGSPGKNTKHFYAKEKFGAYVNVQSHFFDDKLSSVEPGKLVYLGYPRCDYLYAKNNVDTGKLLWGIPKAKFVLWMPTYRQHKSNSDKGIVNDVFNHTFNRIGMPLFYSVEALSDFNAFLADIDMHILYKPHFAQDVSIIKSSALSNIHIIYDADFLTKGVQLYEIMASSQALITDYSSVFFDYLLLDRPIAVTIDDLSEYAAKLGFSYDLEAFHEEAAIRVININELKTFFIDLTLNKDLKSEGRKIIRDITNMHQDGKSTERTVSFILEKINLSKD